RCLTVTDHLLGDVLRHVARRLRTEDTDANVTHAPDVIHHLRGELSKVTLAGPMNFVRSVVVEQDHVIVRACGLAAVLADALETDTGRHAVMTTRTITNPHHERRQIG